MANSISKIKIPSGTVYEVKDDTSRGGITDLRSKIDNLNSVVGASIELREGSATSTYGGTVTVLSGIRIKSGGAYKLTATLNRSISDQPVVVELKKSDGTVYQSVTIPVGETTAESAMFSYIGNTDLENCYITFRNPSGLVNSLTCTVVFDTATAKPVDNISKKLDKPSTEGTAGQVIANDGNGGAEWVDMVQVTADVTDLPEGSSATVTSELVSGVPKLTFGIPAGATGRQGDKGARGDTVIIAKDYADLTFPVYAGKTYCYYGNKPYVANTDIATTEAWTAAHWDEVSFEDEISDLKSALQDMDGGTTGQVLRKRSNSDYAFEWASVGQPTDEQTAQAVSDYLDAHPEQTTTVVDGSLTEVKFSDILKLQAIKDYVTPQMYGAIADNTTDCSQAFANAIASGKIVIVPPGTYKITSAGFDLQNSVFMDGATINVVPSSNISYIFKTGNNQIVGGYIDVANTSYSVGGILTNGVCKVSHLTLMDLTAPALKNASGTYYSVFENIMVGHKGQSTNVISGNVVDFDNTNLPNCNVFIACAFNARCTGVKVAINGRNNEMHGCDISFAVSNDSATALLQLGGTSNVIDFYAEGTVPNSELPVVVVDGSSCAINCSGAFANSVAYQDNGVLNQIIFGVMGQTGNNNYIFNASSWKSIDLYGKYSTVQSPYNSSYTFAKINDDRIESLTNLGDVHQTATATNTGILLTGETSDTQCMLNFNIKKTAVPDAYNAAEKFKGTVEFDVTAPSTFYVVGQTRTSNGERVHVKLNGDQAREVKVSKAAGSLLIENVVFSWMG